MLSGSSVLESSKFVSPEVINAIINCYSEEDKKVVSIFMEELRDSLTNNNNFLVDKLEELSVKRDKKYKMYDLIDSYKEQYNRKLLALVLSGLLTLGIGFGVKTSTENLLHTRSDSATESIDYSDTDKILSSVFGILAIVATVIIPKCGVVSLYGQLSNIKKSILESERNYEELEKQINNLHTNIHKTANANEETLREIDKLFNELLIFVKYLEFENEELDNERIRTESILRKIY